MLVNKPPMGWNTWNTFGTEPSEDLVKRSADAFIKLGLKDAGYEYIVIDDCWSLYDRDKKTGRIVADPAKFPNGMKAVGDYIHSKGLKFGMYSCAGVRTCADYPASYGHEFEDARTFADFGVDYLKYDYCYKPVCADGKRLYMRMGNALRSCGRDILFSACNWGAEESYKWMRATGAHSFRSTGDIIDSFVSYKNIVISQEDLHYASAPQCFNDMDMLTVGMYGKGLVGSTGCDFTDYRAQFSLWCMFASSLMLGCDITNIDEKTLELVKNKYLIRINQDEETRPPIDISATMNASRHGEFERVYFRQLSDGEYAFCFWNLSDKKRKIFAFMSQLGLEATDGLGFEFRDVFTGEVTGVYNEYAIETVEPRDVHVYIAKLVPMK